MAEIIQTLTGVGQPGGVFEDANIPKNLIPATVAVHLLDWNDRVWLQIRRADKSMGGLLDAAACGNIREGESPEDAALRGLKEQAGLRTVELTSLGEMMVKFTEDGLDVCRYPRVFAVRTHQVPQITDEVDGFKRVNIDDIHNDIVNNPGAYTPTVGEQLLYVTAKMEEVLDV